MSEHDNSTVVAADRLPDHALAAFYQEADAHSIRSQKSHFAALRVQLIALVVAGAGGAFAASSPVVFRVNLAGLLAALAFGTAILVRVFAEYEGFEKQWYRSRAAAESAKTLCWRYSVAGQPFPEDLAPAQADDLLLHRLRDVSRSLAFVPAGAEDAGTEITAGMRQLRAAARDDRSSVYLGERVERQRRWYVRNSKQSEAAARRWLGATLLVEAVGVALAFALAFSIIAVDLLGLVAALATGFGAWLAAKQHRTLAEAYNVTAVELRTLASGGASSASSAAWSDFVDQAEEAMSREHAVWFASRIGSRSMGA